MFKSGKFNSACRRWDEKLAGDKTWYNFKIHFAAAYRQHRQIQGETLGSQVFTNAAVAQAEDDLAEQALGAFVNLATATDVDRGVVSQLTEANSRLAKKNGRQCIGPQGIQGPSQEKAWGPCWK
jgi:hypothetical protein